LNICAKPKLISHDTGQLKDPI